MSHPTMIEKSHGMPHLASLKIKLSILVSGVIPLHATSEKVHAGYSMKRDDPDGSPHFVVT